MTGDSWARAGDADATHGFQAVKPAQDRTMPAQGGTNYGFIPDTFYRIDAANVINNTVGQALLARRMGKKRLIAETGAGQHGVATATVGAKFGFPVDVYMGAVDVERQALNVYIMKLLGAQVHAVQSGTRTLKDATNEAFRVWAGEVEDTFYVIGSVVGAHPYPYMVREFQKVIGIETRRQCLERYGRLPSDVVACVGGGSNAMGIFAGFLDDPNVRLWGVEAAGEGLTSGKTAAALAAFLQPIPARPQPPDPNTDQTVHPSVVPEKD